MSVRRAIGLALLICLAPCYFARGEPSAEEDLRVGDARIHIVFARDLPLPHLAFTEWVRRAAVAVTHYLGGFPTAELRLNIQRGRRDPVSDGVAYGNKEIDVRIGRRAKAFDLNEDWILTHEMFHLAFPTLPHRYLWMMEGLSDYLEPIARCRAGQMTAEAVWREFVEGLPQGLPSGDDHGLDNNLRRERIYWGGNLYWLLADVEIRTETHNGHSIDDAIRAIWRDGGNGGVEWPLEKVLKVGDNATKTTVLKDLYGEFGPKPGTVDLEQLWRKLGVKYNNGQVTFDNNAIWAGVRAAITSGR